MLVMLGFLATMDATNPPRRSSRLEGNVIAIIGAIAKYNHVIIDLHSNVQVLKHNRNRIALPLHRELNVIPCILTLPNVALLFFLYPQKPSMRQCTHLSFHNFLEQ
jgi:hypothetical protein